MKKLAAAGISMLMLIGMVTASAGNAGSAGDPLISLSYIDGQFTQDLKKESGEAAGKALGEAYDRALSRLDEIYKSHIGYSYVPGFTELGMSDGKQVTLTIGSSFVLLYGTAVLNVTGGQVINVSTGFAVSDGSLLAQNQRYFCTEDAVAVITASGDALGMVDGYFRTNGVLDPNKTMFKDVRRSDWFFPAVDFAYENGLFSGTSADMFSPSVPMTRAMFVTVLHRLAGSPDTGSDKSFSDVQDAGQYYYKPVVWASENAIVTGYEDGTFLPGQTITREQMALIMYRYASFSGLDMTSPGSVFDEFPDRGDVSPYAVEAMRWSTANGIINGSDGRLLPTETATRAQVAQIIYNFCSKGNILALPDDISMPSESAIDD